MTLEKVKIEGLSEEELQQLFHKLGLGALKYYLLKVDPKKRMLFNPEESVRLEGDTGPFIQYSYARTAKIQRDAKADGIVALTELDKIASLEPSESELIQVLAGYAGAVTEAARQLSPAIIAQYAYDVARSYNRFYREVPILKEADLTKKSFRLALTAKTGVTIKTTLGLLGIEVPERM